MSDLSSDGRNQSCCVQHVGMGTTTLTALGHSAAPAGSSHCPWHWLPLCITHRGLRGGHHLQISPSHQTYTEAANFACPLSEPLPHQLIHLPVTKLSVTAVNLSLKKVSATMQNEYHFAVLMQRRYTPRSQTHWLSSSIQTHELHCRL